MTVEAYIPERAERVAACAANGHTTLVWNAPKIGINKLLCTACGSTFPLHGDTDHTPKEAE